MHQSFEISSNQIINSWELKIAECEIDVCQIASDFGLQIGIKLDSPLGLYVEKDQIIYLQNPDLSIFSFWIFLHELGHHQNTLQEESSNIQKLYSLKDDTSFLHNLDLFFQYTSQFQLSHQTIFQSDFENWTRLNSELQSVNVILNALQSSFGLNPMAQNQFFFRAEPYRQKKDILENDLKQIYETYHIQRFLKIPVAVSELLAWSHALEMFEVLTGSQSNNLLQEERIFTRFKDHTTLNISLLDFMCITLKSHNSHLIFDDCKTQSPFGLMSLSKELKTLIYNSQFHFNQYIALNLNK